MMTIIYLVTIPLIAVILTTFFIRIRSMQDRIGLLQEHINLLDNYITERLRAKGNNYLWEKPAVHREADLD